MVWGPISFLSFGPRSRGEPDLEGHVTFFLALTSRDASPFNTAAEDT
jgi:hypothetical protein